MGGITVVIPVYGDWESLNNNILSLRYVLGDNSKYKILYINDCGPDADDIEVKLKVSIEGWATAQYSRNPSNLGFIQTCNTAVYRLDDTENDILLLNSDTVVTPNFLDNMLIAFEQDYMIASVSPRSNNATIFSVPLKGALENNYPLEKSLLIYNCVKSQLPDIYDTPTTHGFCMLIRRAVIKKFDLFDEIYGRGYGEENDFCMRVAEKGYRHVIANKSFVYHEGSKSFTSKGRDEQIRKNGTILAERYPEYESKVAEYMNRVVYPEQDQIREILKKKFQINEEWV